jgi:hypothetical protein
MADVRGRQAAARRLTNGDGVASTIHAEIIMSQQSDVRKELTNPVAEPLLPIEKKLIGWSLGLGIVLLLVLTLLARLWPVTL